MSPSLSRRRPASPPGLPLAVRLTQPRTAAATLLLLLSSLGARVTLPAPAPLPARYLGPLRFSPGPPADPRNRSFPRRLTPRAGNAGSLPITRQLLAPSRTLSTRLRSPVYALPRETFAASGICFRCTRALSSNRPRCPQVSPVFPGDLGARFEGVQQWPPPTLTSLAQFSIKHERRERGSRSQFPAKRERHE